MRLTDKDVKNLSAAPGQRVEIPDDIQRGLRIRVTDKGVKTWSVQRRINGRKRRFTIGAYPEIGLAEARDRAARLLVQAADGHDPVAEKRQRRLQPVEPAKPT
ncbi:MAG: Arm DNA-binding domain-containing protein, partial [Anderseniella sp.]|nr:Arm DNA-binding domain-containing protein [Anderseniella sp.]